MVKLERCKVLGKVLLESGAVTEEQLNQGLEEQRKAGGGSDRIGKILLRLGFLNEACLVEALGKQLNIPVTDLTQYTLKSEVVVFIPKAMALEYEVIALSLANLVESGRTALAIAMTDPLNVFAISEVEKHTGYSVIPTICTESAIGLAIMRGYDWKAVEFSEYASRVWICTCGKINQTLMGGLEMPQCKFCKEIFIWGKQQSE